MHIPSMPSLTPKVRSTDSSARAFSSFAFGPSPGPGEPTRGEPDVSCLRKVDTSTNSVEAGVQEYQRLRSLESVEERDSPASIEAWRDTVVSTELDSEESVRSL